MAAVIDLPVAGERIQLYNQTWDTYERFLAEHDGERSVRVSFDEGYMEVMVVSARHDRPNDAIRRIIETIADELGRNYVSFGQATIKRKDLQKGFEPDASYYFSHLEQVRPRSFDLTYGPAPDLIVEVDITSDSRVRFRLFAAVGVSEVWRHDGKRLRFLRLDAGKYVESDFSLLFPFLKATAADKMLNDYWDMETQPWLESIRTWVRKNRPKS